MKKIKKRLIQYNDGRIFSSSGNIRIELFGKKPIKEIEVIGKTDKEIKQIKEQLTKSFKDSNIKKAGDSTANSDKRTL